MSHPASVSVLSLFSPFAAPGPRDQFGARDQSGARVPGPRLDPIQKGSRILLGSIDAPFLPAQGRDLVPLREMLRAWRESARPDEASGLTIAITTRSPLLLHDLELLVELDRDHAVSVDVLLPDLDPEVVRELEPHLQYPPAPAARLELVRRLAVEGIATRVLCVPLPSLPPLLASAPERRLAALFAAARDAGAWDLATDADDPARAARPGRPARRNRFRAWKRWSSSALPLPSPRLHTRGQRHPQPAQPAATSLTPQTSAPAETVLTTFYRLRLEHGFPRATPGRG